MKHPNGRAKGLPGKLARTFRVKSPAGALTYTDPRDPATAIGTLPPGAIAQGTVTHAREVLGESRWVRRLGRADWLWLGALEELR